MPNHKIYIHEFIDIIGHNRANYMHHMTANFSPMAQRERDQLCYGVWGTVGTTRRWPEVVNMWEEDGWDGHGQLVPPRVQPPDAPGPGARGVVGAGRAVPPQRHRPAAGPGAWTRTIEELCADGVRGECYAHELVTLEPDTAWHYVDDLVREQQAPRYEQFGWELAGAFVTAMKDDSEAIVLWAIPTWEQWAELEKATRSHPTLRAWRTQQAEVSTGLDRFLMVDAPLSPFRTGRQPQDSDRDSYQLPDD